MAITMAVAVLAVNIAAGDVTESTQSAGDVNNDVITTRKALRFLKPESSRQPTVKI